MQLHQIKPLHKLKKRKRVGRGGKRGTYSGRGMKGQKSRSGRRLPPAIRGLIKRYPKLRGYRFKSIKEKIAIVSIGVIEKKFKSGETINPQVLLKKEIIRKIKGKVPVVKILGKEKLTKKVIIEDCEISKGAKEIIEKAGGTIKNSTTKT
jgi:large subunit ribosomal protein L15